MGQRLPRGETTLPESPMTDTASEPLPATGNELAPEVFSILGHRSLLWLAGPGVEDRRDSPGVYRHPDAINSGGWTLAPAPGGTRLPAKLMAA